jgi:hypothetical protein
MSLMGGLGELPGAQGSLYPLLFHHPSYPFIFLPLLPLPHSYVKIMGIHLAPKSSLAPGAPIQFSKAGTKGLGD